MSHPALQSVYPHIAARVYNTPLMIHPDKARVIEAVLRGRAEGAPLPAEAVEWRENRQGKPYRVTERGTGVISIYGTLVHRAMGFDAWSGLTGYTRLAARLRTAMEDREVLRILFDVDSPGGEVSGLYDLASKIRAANESKPVWAIANESTYSAAYALAVAAGRLITPRTGNVGSVGVIALHVDQSARDEKQGYRYTPVYAGARKNDFSPHQPLSGRAEAWLQAEVDRMHGMFIEHVARERGIEAGAVRGTEAAVLNADDALELGFIDAVAGFDDTIEEMESAGGGSGFSMRASARAPEGGPAMAREDTTAADDRPAGQFTQYDLDQARQEGHDAGHAQGLDEGQQKGTGMGRDLERGRIRAILTCEPAQVRMGQAIAMALDTDLEPEAASALLAKSPKENTTGGGFEAAMAALGNPAIGPDGATEDDDARAEAKRVLATLG